MPPIDHLSVAERQPISSCHDHDGVLGFSGKANPLSLKWFGDAWNRVRRIAPVNERIYARLGDSF